MRSTRDFLTGILTGVAIGILTAPRSGKETRKMLTDEANKRSEDIKDQWDKGVAQAKEGYQQVREQANQYIDKAKTQVNQFTQKGGDTGNEFGNTYNTESIKDQYNDKVEELADDAQYGIERNKDSFKVD